MVRPVLVLECAVLVFYPGLGAEQAGPKTYRSYGSRSSSGKIVPLPLFLASPNDLKVVGNEKQEGSGRSLTFNDAPYLDGAPCPGL
jgi:hypothetical protein